MAASQHVRDASQGSDLPQTPTGRSPTNLVNLANMSRIDGTQVRIKNKEIAQKTEDVQREFEQLMGEIVQRRQLGGKVARKAPEIDEILDGYYMPGPERKHKSPTRRLINHKNSTTEHKKKIYSGIAKGEYSQTYCISPGKTYVIEAQGGELPYELAAKRPADFYSTVLHQDIKKYKVKMRGRQEFEWTQRPLLKIITTIKDKII